jgi:universal stress protein E
MDRYRSLVVGLDLAPDGRSLSRGSAQAAREAQALAERTGARLSFLHSTFRESVTFEGDPTHPEEPLSPDSLEVLERACRDCAGDSASLEIVTAPAWLELIRWVVSGRADLVVVARRNHAAADGRSLGTNALKLLRKCPAPVWSVNPERSSFEGCVVAATDLSPVGRRATELAGYFASTFDLEWHIVHAYQISLSLQMSGDLETAAGSPGEPRARLEKDLRVRIEEGLADFDPAPQLHVGCDAPNHAIESALEHLKPSLLVMGSLSRTGLAGLLVGNTAERLLPHVDCSLLTVKPEGFVSPVV